MRWKWRLPYFVFVKFSIAPFSFGEKAPYKDNSKPMAEQGAKSPRRPYGMVPVLWGRTDKGIISEVSEFIIVG